MPWYINGNELYEQTAEWEAQAIAHVEKLNSTPLNEMTTDQLEEWRKWSYILHERSAFKYDLENALTADVVEVKHGKWIFWDKNRVMCSMCKLEPYAGTGAYRFMYCPYCGAKMDGKETVS